MTNSIPHIDLLDATRHAVRAHPELTAFAPFPGDVASQVFIRRHLPSADFFHRHMQRRSPAFPALHKAIRDFAKDAYWRDTYADTGIGDDFMTRFGCYGIVGPDAPFSSDNLRVWVVFMPPNLFYPRHHHPAEEIYLVVSGRARFSKDGAAERVLGPGDTSFHASNQPHAMATQDDPVLCLVFWRDQFETEPVLTDWRQGQPNSPARPFSISAIVSSMP